MSTIVVFSIAYFRQLTSKQCFSGILPPLSVLGHRLLLVAIMQSLLQRRQDPQAFFCFAELYRLRVRIHHKAKTFGSNPECNENAVVVLFRPFSALYAGRIVCWIVTVIVVAVYTVITVKDYLPPPPKKLYQWIQKRRVRKPVVQLDPLESGPDLEFNDTADGRSRRNGDTRNQNRIKQQVSYQVPSEG